MPLTARLVAQTNGKRAPIRSSVIPLHHQKLCQIDGKQFGDAVEKDLEAYGMNGKFSVKDGKDTLYNQTRPKKNLPKPGRFTKLKVNSQFIWTFNFFNLYRWDQVKLNPLNSQF